MEDYLVLLGLLGGVWLFLLWLAVIVWVYRDIRGRTRDLGLQVLAVFVAMIFFPLFNIPGVALYLMMRPHETLEEAYARSLEEETLLREIGDEGICPSCRRFVERGWKVCPFCRTHLKDVCAGCEQLLSFNWVLCPYCSTERQPSPNPQPARGKRGAEPAPVASAGGSTPTSDEAAPTGEETAPSGAKQSVAGR